MNNNEYQDIAVVTSQLSIFESNIQSMNLFRLEYKMKWITFHWNAMLSLKKQVDKNSTRTTRGILQQLIATICYQIVIIVS